MNQTNLARLIEHLKQVPDRRFDMRHFVIQGNHLAQTVSQVKPYNKCESHGCIAGHIIMAFRDEVDEQTSFSGAAGKWLGIDDDHALELFLGIGVSRDLSSFTRTLAIEHLETLVDV